MKKLMFIKEQVIVRINKHLIVFIIGLLILLSLAVACNGESISPTIPTSTPEISSPAGTSFPSPSSMSPPAPSISPSAGTPFLSPSTKSGHNYTVNPGQSIQSAINKMVSGDTCIINAGTYRESLKISTSGLTIQGNGSPVIDAHFASDNVVYITADHVTLQGLVLQNSRGSGVLFNGPDSHDNVIDHCTIHGWVCSAEGVEYIKNTYPYTYSGAVNINMGAYNITVSNCLIDRGNVETGNVMDTKAISWSWDDVYNPPRTGGGNKFINNIIWGISRDSNGHPITKQADFGDGYPLNKFNIWDGISGRDGMNLVNWNNTLIQGNHIYGAFDDCIEPEANAINLTIDSNYIDPEGGAYCIVLRGASIGPVYITNNIMVNAGLGGFKYGGWSLGPGTASKYISNNTYFSTLSRDYQPYPSVVLNTSSYNRFIDGEVNDNNYNNLFVDNNYVHTRRYFVSLMWGSGNNNTFTNNHFTTNDQLSCVKWFGDVISLDAFNAEPGCSGNIWQIIPMPKEPSPPDAGAGNQPGPL